ncbi:probable glutamate receptor [Palaemon carinicauda]|uniref:probable glutamate receptor n=1 Tax=Palaemon carinicauda TaxID=392227 RepID=UPI0035B63BB7
MMMMNSSECLQLGVLTWMPHIIITGSPGKRLVTGSMIEVMDIIARHLGFCYKMIVSKDEIAGVRMPNGTWTGLIGDITKENFTFTGLGLSITPERAEDFDFTEYLYMEEWSAGFKRPQPEPDIAGFVKPYTFEAWILLIFSVVIVLGTSFLLRLITSKALRYKRKDLTASFLSPWQHNKDEVCVPEAHGNFKSSSAVYDSVLWTVSSLLGVSIQGSPSGEAVRLFTALWIMASFIIATVYRSNLNAMLISPTIHLPFNSLEELVESGLPVWTATGAMLHIAAQNAPNDTLLGRILTQFYGVQCPTNVPLAIKNMNEGVSVAATPRSALMQIMHTTFSALGKCVSYTMTDTYFKSNAASILLPKGSPWKGKLNPVITRLRESGLLNYAFSKGLQNATECLKAIRAKRNVSLRTLEFKDFYGVFLVFAGGMTIASASFVAEVFSKRKISNKKN